VTPDAKISQIDPAAARTAGATIVDVRSANEWAHGHIPGALHIPLGYLADRTGEIPSSKPVIVQCQSGARSSIAASVLERHHVANVSNLTGGIAAWAAAGLPIEEPSHEQEAARA
jgi:hydroxyacylglutathione hydrolase